ANTTLVPGSITATPIAIDDSYNVIGNVRIQPNAAQGLLANDCDPNPTGPCTSAGLTASGPTTGPSNGQVTINGDGSFSYNPNPGYEGPDSFTYTISDGTSTDTATVTLNVSEMIWFIDDSAAAGGDGRLNTPFDSIAAFVSSAADEPNDNIFLYSGNYTGGLTLLSGQALVGEGSTASLATVTNITPPSYSAALPATGGANPVIGGSTGITVATSNLIRGVTIANTGGTGISGSNFGTLAVADTTINATSQALDLDTGQLDATFQSISSDGSMSAAVRLANIAVGSTFSGGATTINNRGTTGIELDNVEGSIAFGATTVANQMGAGGYGVSVRDSGAAVSFASATISDTNQVVAQVDTTPADSLPDNDGDGDAIFLKSNTGSFSVGGGALTNCGNDCVDAREASNVTLTNVAISSPGLDVASPGLGTGGHGVYALNLTGTNGLSGGSVSATSGASRDGVLVVSNMFTQTFNVAGTTFQNTTGGIGVRANASGTASVTLNVGGATNNVATNCTFSGITGSAVSGSTIGTSTLNLTVQNSTFQNAPADGKTNVIATVMQTGHGSFNVLNNTFSNVSRTTSTAEGVINLTSSANVAGNTFSANVSGNTITGVGSSVANCGGGAVACLGPLNAIVINPGGASSVTGTIIVDGNVLTDAQQGGVSLTLSNAGVGSSAVNAKIINNTLGTTAAPIGNGAAALARSGIRVERTTNGGPTGNNVLISGNSIRNGNGGSASALNAPGIFIRTQNTNTMDATVTGNNVDTNTSTVVAELRVDTSSAGSTQCLDASGNTFASGSGLIVLNETAGALNVEQANAAALATANGGATVTETGTPNYNLACAAPVASLNRLNTNGQYLAAAPATKDALGLFYLTDVRPHVTFDLMSSLDAWRSNSKSLGGLSFGYAAKNVALGSALTDTVVRPAREVAPAAPAYAAAASLPAFSGETVNVNIGTLPAGKSMTITFQVTIDNDINVPQVSNQGTVSGTNFGSVLTDDPSEGGSADPTVTPVFLGTPPDISCPADISVGTDPGVSTASVSFSVTATGNPTPTVECKVGATVIASPHTFPLGETTVMCTATNGVEPDDSCSFKVTVTDDEAPVIDCPDDITVSLPPNSNATTVAVNFTVTATDNADPTPTINTDFPSGYAFPVGTTTVTATATDDAGNESTCQFNVTVLYNFTGFFSPVSNPPVLNEVKAGQGIPIKFSLSGNKGLSIFFPDYPASQQINCADNVPINVLEETESSGGSSLSYNAGSDTYTYNWKTEKSWAGTCRVLVVKLADGTEHIAYFKFK
ncbi:MAG TPA: PxKF domain-containing protein, partial [Pyrinomonadaceae bacterium]